MTENQEIMSTHNKILNSALIVFSEKGYSDATIKDISKKAGCNTVTIFRHFESKEQLFKEVVDTYNTFDFDADDLDSKLSYMNMHNDFRVMADYFFTVIFNNIHKLRIFINDNQNFDFVQKYAWFIPEELKSFVSDYLLSMYPEELQASEISLISEMFVCYILRTCLRLNVDEGVEENSRQLVKDKRPVLAVSVDMIVDMVMLLAGKNKKSL